MFDFVAWCTSEAEDGSELQRRAEEYLRARTPGEWQGHSWSGAGWGVVVRHAQMPRWRWSFATRRDEMHVVAAGVPLGLGPTTPAELGLRLLAGEDLHAEVCVPFGLLAVDDRSGRCVVQQDWHGMGQLFLLQTPRGFAVSNRPSALPTVLGEPIRPSLQGWAYYVGTDTFAGGSSPVRDVRQLGPGERLVADRRGTTWRVRSEAGRSIDDVVAEAAATPADLDAIVDSVHAGIAASLRDLAYYWPDSPSMGLSGGKDSRLLAAVALGEGLVPDYTTNEENPVEGDVARTLAAAQRAARGSSFAHEFYVATQHDQILRTPIVERARALQHRHDFMFRGNYLKRPLEGPRPTQLDAPSLTGIFGEYVSGYWVPDRWPEDGATYDDTRRVLRRRLSTGAPWGMLGPRPRQWLDAFVDDLLARAQDLGLSPAAAINYGYMMGRIRRAPTALTHPDQIMPMGVPALVRASVQLAHDDAVNERVHTILIERVAPEWAAVPFVQARTGVDPATKLRIWHGTGQEELEQLFAAGPGPITKMMRRKAVAEALQRCRSGEAAGPEDRLLRQFTMAAVAEQTMDEVPLSHR